jgi:hypothetical protein
MTATFDHPRIEHRLAAVIRLVDAFTGMPIEQRYDVRLAGQEWWTPRFAEVDSTYRFQRTNRPLPALGTIGVTVSPAVDAPTHRDLGGLTVTIPPAGPAPVPVTILHYLVEHPLWPIRSFRPPPGETFVRGRVIRANVGVPDQRVRIAAGAAPTLTDPAAPTDADGEFSYRLPQLRIQAATTTTVVAVAPLFVAVTDAGGAPQTIATPTLPITVPLGRSTAVTLNLA